MPRSEARRRPQLQRPGPRLRATWRGASARRGHWAAAAAAGSEGAAGAVAVSEALAGWAAGSPAAPAHRAEGLQGGAAGPGAEASAGWQASGSTGRWALGATGATAAQLPPAIQAAWQECLMGPTAKVTWGPVRRAGGRKGGAEGRRRRRRRRGGWRRWGPVCVCCVGGEGLSSASAHVRALLAPSAQTGALPVAPWLGPRCAGGWAAGGRRGPGAPADMQGAPWAPAPRRAPGRGRRCRACLVALPNGCGTCQ
jgi:hypothetical protein